MHHVAARAAATRDDTRESAINIRKNPLEGKKMQKLAFGIWVSITSVAAIPSWAATVVEQRGMQGNVQKIIINMPTARIESSRPTQYMLVNMQEKKMYMVDSEHKRILVVDMAATAPTNPPPQAPTPPVTVEARLDKKGDGPEIAGYATVHYQTLANNMVCSNEYLSADALKIESIKTFLLAMEDLASARKKMLRAMATPQQQDPCAQAYDKLQSEYKAIGVPLKTTDKEGKVINEIASIQVDVTVAADLFVLPKEYKLTTEEEMRKEFMQKMEEARRQPGNNPPGAMPPPPQR